MEVLSEAEMAILNAWCQTIRTTIDLSVRHALLQYLMTEILIDYYQRLPDDMRPDRPTEKALIAIGSSSGRLSERRDKWQKLWDNICKFFIR